MYLVTDLSPKVGGMHNGECATAIERYAARLAGLAATSGLSKSELARRVRLSRQTLATRMDNPGAMTVTEMARLELALEVDMADVLGAEDAA